MFRGIFSARIILTVALLLPNSAQAQGLPQDRAGAGEPSRRIYHTIIAHRESGHLLLFGGQTQHRWEADLKDVWAFYPTSSAWHFVGDYQASLGEKHGQAPAYDPVSNRVIVLNSEGETWAFDYSSTRWENRNPPFGPSGRAGHRMAFDRQSEKLILFGGFRGQTIDDPPLSDTWAYDFEKNEWEQMTPEVSPPARMYHAMEYDSESDRVILWGGRKLEPLEDNSVWAFDYDSDTWTEWETSGGPAGALGYPTMVYLESMDRMFVFGGVDLEAPFEGDLSDQSWFFDFNINQWTSLSPTNRPRPVAIHSAACDPASGLIFVFGGERGTPYSNDTNDELWSYDPALGSWRRW